jgi:AraC family transcriptional regulator
MTSRTPVFESLIGRVERVEYCSGSRRRLSAETFSPDFQVGFPYRGAFVWHVGDDAVMSDPNQILFIKGGEPFRIQEQRPDGFGEVIITPTESTLRDASAAAGFDLERHPLFAVRSRRATPDLQRRCVQFLHQAAANGGGLELGANEALVALLRDALRIDIISPVASPRTRQLIRRAKEYLDVHFTHRLQLPNVAAAVGASPAYLTDVFRCFEGISLQRYVTQLRLARALVELPHAPDITRLALDVGFSSHSHFTLAFRRAFGCTPSHFRGLTRQRIAQSTLTTGKERDSRALVRVAPPPYFEERV